MLAAMQFLVCVLLVVVLSCSKHQVYGQELSVTITVDYTPPPGFTPGPNEYRAASGPVTVTCTAIGGAGPLVYQWSSTCRNCPFQTATSSVLTRYAVHSGDNGTHTCTTATGTRITGTSSINFNIVGAGIHVFSGYPLGSRPSNGLLVSQGDGTHLIRFFCRSDSTMENVGELIGLDGSVVNSNNFFDIINPQPGELEVINIAGTHVAFTSSEQGVYTCRIPLQSGEIREINIGIYPSGFNNSPTISNLEFSHGSSSSTLSCTSTGSPATTVLWMRDGQLLTIGGTAYQLTQTVTNRRESTYENVLTISDQVSDIINHTYSCSVTNALGSFSLELLVFAVEVTGLEQPLTVGETASVVCASILRVSSIQWLFDDELVKEDTSGLQELDLTFSPVNDSIHNRQYICKVTADGTTYSYPITVMVEVPTSEALTVFLNPHGNPTAGESYTLTCTALELIAGLKNMPSLQWLDSSGSAVNGADITVGELQITDSAAILALTFDPVHTSHAGEYSCQAMLESPAVVGSVMESVVNTIIVSIPTPVLVMSRDPDASVTLRHGDSLTLTCTIQLDLTVDSDVSVIGELRGAQLQVRFDSVMILSEGVYQFTGTIPSLQATLSDTYTCTAEIEPASGVISRYISSSNSAQSTLDIAVELDVSIEISYTPPPGFTPSPNEYRAASGPVTVTCTAIGGTGSVDYRWSSTCRNCPFQTAASNSFYRPAVHSGDTGTHTCTTTDNVTGVIGSESVEFSIVGAGIFVFNGEPSGSAPNNGLVVSVDRGSGFNLRIFCRSDSLVENIGELIGLDGSTVASNNFLSVHHNITQAIELRIENTAGIQDPISDSARGVYTCRIPLRSGLLTEVNIGIYPSGFNTLPTISNLEFDPTANSLTCISTDSPATTVTWMRDGQALTIDGSTHQLIQTVTNRRESTYENVLTINDQLSTVGHVFRCTVTNALGSTTEDVQALGFPSITNIEFDPTVQSLTCTVSATTVNWMRDGQPLTIDGSTYHTVTNRITSVESTNINENVLILNEPQSNIVGHTYTCTASSSGIKGTSSQDINIVLPPVENVTVITINATVVNVSWVALELLGWNVSHYTLYYTAFSIEQKRAVGGFSRQYPGNTISVVFTPMTKPEQIQHVFYLTANVGMYEGPQSEKASIIFDKEFFQLQIGPVEHCISWQPENAQNIEAAIQTAISEAISFQCKCTFPREFIRRGRFSCRNVTTEATYRSTIVGTMSHNASQLVNFIQNWVHSRPAIEVEWWLMDVYTNCPVRISSLTGLECQVARLISSDETLITTDPAVIQCVNVCLYRRRGNVCQV